MTDNIIFIGNKEFMRYIKAVTTQFQNQAQKEVVIIARGRHINRAVDVEEVIRNKFMKNIIVKEVELGSEEFDDKNIKGKKISVSTIKIVLEKKEDG